MAEQWNKPLVSVKALIDGIESGNLPWSVMLGATSKDHALALLKDAFSKGHRLI